MSILYGSLHGKSTEDILCAMEAFTEQYRLHETDPTPLRELACLRAQFPAALGAVEADDLFAGKRELPPIGFAPQYGDGFGLYIDEDKLTNMIKSADKAQRERLVSLRDYWLPRTGAHKTRAAYPGWVSAALPSDNWTSEPGIAFPLYRMSGIHLDYGKLLTLGVPGLRALVERRAAQSPKEDAPLFDGMLGALELFCDCCRYYEAQSCSDDRYDLADCLRDIAGRKPETFREAIQLMWLYWILSGTNNFGRMDTYLADFYVNDVDSGALTEEMALELLCGLWRLMAREGLVYDTRVVIGGAGRSNPQNGDRFAVLAMEAARRVRECLPQLTLRFDRNTPGFVMEKAFDTLADGTTYPMLYDDAVNIPAVMKAFGLPYGEAVDYCPFGCGEYVIYRRSVGTPSGVINLLRALDSTLRGGIDGETGRALGLNLGRFEDFTTFDELLDAYKKQVEYHVASLAEQEEIEYKIAAQDGAYLFMSMLFDDCVERGKAIFAGGARYLGGTLETYGNTNTADSLAAIKTLVYDEKRLTKKQMLDALDADFAGFEHERGLMLNAPKYGNDDDAADAMAVFVHEHICNVTRDMKKHTSLDSYLVVIINNNANSTLGLQTGASPDGRRAHTFMANANNPSGGMDKNGVTAMLNSLVKLDPSLHAGSVQNMKFSKELFAAENRGRLRALLDTYFENGGQQAMITVLSRQDLEDALACPEEHRNLIVRVGGFSARYVELGGEEQREILSRTLY